MPFEYLGRGPIAPFRRDQNDFAVGDGVALARSHAEQILGTRADSPQASGEMPWRTEAGSKLYLLRHRRDSPVVRALAVAWAQEALARWEPRIRVTSAVMTNIPGKPTAKVVRVTFDVVDRNVTGTVPLMDPQTIDVVLPE